MFQHDSGTAMLVQIKVSTYPLIFSLMSTPTPTLDTLILASKKFHTFGFISKLATFTLATLINLHYKICKKKLKLATFKISYLH